MLPTVLAEHSMWHGLMENSTFDTIWATFLCYLKINGYDGHARIGIPWNSAHHNGSTLNAPLGQRLQCGCLLIPPVRYIALEGHKLAILPTHLHDMGIQHAFTNVQMRAGAMLRESPGSSSSLVEYSSTSETSSSVTASKTCSTTSSACPHASMISTRNGTSKPPTITTKIWGTNTG